MRFTANQMFRIREEDFNDVESWLRAAEASGRNIRYGMNALAMMMARTNQAFAMQMSRGPNDPQMRNPGSAWKIPVRRITGRYYRGWKVKRLAPGAWILYNDTREAYFIEYGINHLGGGSKVSGRGGHEYNKGSRRVRRPIRKLSLIKTLRAVDSTHVNHRIWESMFAPFRVRSGRAPSGRGAWLISDAPQSVEGMRFL